MTRTYDCHVFAHKDGRYQSTHASTGVTNTERTALEQFFFGQTNNEQYLASLAQEPGVIWRRVDGRFALTRVLAGKKDANGRATLRFETLVIPAEASGIVDNLAALVRSTWRFSSEGASSTFSVEARPQELHMDKVSSIVLDFRASKRIVARSPTLSLTDVEKIVSLCRNDPAFSLCYKSLNDRAPVAINLVFGDVTERQIMTRTTTMQAHPNREPVRSVPGRPPPTGIFMPIALCLVLLLQIITLFVVGSSSNPSPSDEMQGHIITRVEHESQKGSDERRAGFGEVSKKIDGTWQKLSELEEQSSLRSSKLKSDLEKVRGDVNSLKNIAAEQDKRLHQAIRNLVDTIGSNHRKALQEHLKLLRKLKKKLDSLAQEQKDIHNKLKEITKPEPTDKGNNTSPGQDK